ncbi:MAG TPA: metallophosphoesterase [Polyangiaceae bacterium]|nr:metallophosphoesterase [Polyangiaceae bacterium]
MIGCGSRADLGTALDLHDQQPSATAAGAWPSSSGGRTGGAVTTSTKVSNNLGGSGAMILGGNKPQGTLGSANVGGGTGGSKAPWALAGAASGRIVAIGDLHSDIQATRRAFELAGATNPDGEWIGGALTVVQLGDLIGRGDDERQVLDFIFDLRGKAEAAGGKLYNLIGNHEIMAARVDNQAVGNNPFPGFEDLPDLALDDPRLQQLPENQRARGAALMAGGTIAKRLAEFETVLQIGQTIFVHGGVTPKWAQYGIDQINHEVSQWLSSNISVPTSTLGYDDGDRVMWTRQFSSGVDVSDCALLEQTLSMLGTKRMVVAHTVQPTIRSLCNEQLWIIDVGMARYYGGPIEVLQIEDDTYLTVLRY